MSTSPSPAGAEQPRLPAPAPAPRSNAFVRKVFGIVTIQLLVTVGVACACMYVDSVRTFVRQNPSM